MSQDSSHFRSKDQVLFDLSKALGFSPESLSSNRTGKLTTDQFKQHIGRCVSPLGMAVFCAAGPILFWSALVGMREHASFVAALGIFFGQMLHLSEMLENQGKLSTLATVGSVIAGLGLGAFNFMRFSPGLYFDLLSRQVVTREGRVLAREEQTMRPNGRDPIEKYFFDVKTDRYTVNLAAYRALESGGIYLMYVLPRSGILISLEPKVTRTAEPAVKNPPPAKETAPATSVST